MGLVKAKKQHLKQEEHNGKATQVWTSVPKYRDVYRPPILCFEVSTQRARFAATQSQRVGSVPFVAIDHLGF